MPSFQPYFVCLGLFLLTEKKTQKMERSQQLQTCQLNIILLMLIQGSCFNVQTVEAALYPQTKRELEHIRLSIQYHELWYSYL